MKFHNLDMFHNLDVQFIKLLISLSGCVMYIIIILDKGQFGLQNHPLDICNFEKKVLLPFFLNGYAKLNS